MTLFDSCSTRSAVEFDFGFLGGWGSTPTESGASTYLGAASSDVMNLILWLQAIMAETQGVAEEQPDSYNNLNPLEIDRQKTISWAFPFPEARIWEAGFESQRNVWPDFDDQCLDEMKGTHYRRPRRTGRDTCGRQIRHSGLFQIEGTHMLKADRARAALAVGFVGATSAGKSWLAGILNEGPGWYGRWPILGKHFFSAR